MENNSLGARIRTIRKAKRLTQKALAVLIESSGGYICEIEKGKKSPGSEFLFRLSQETGANLQWLKDGSGEMFTKTVTGAGNINEQLSPFIFNTLTRADKNKVVAEVGEILDSENDDIITALVKNVQEFKRAVVTSKRLNVCEEELKTQKKEIDDLRGQVKGLTAPPTSAERSADSSAEEKT